MVACFRERFESTLYRLEVFQTVTVEFPVRAHGSYDVSRQNLDYLYRFGARSGSIFSKCSAVSCRRHFNILACGGLLCFILQGLCAYELIAHYVDNVWVRLIGTEFFSSSVRL